MLAVIPSPLREIPDRWRALVRERRTLTAIDPAADALEKCARELEDAMTEAANAGRMLTPEEYAAPRGISPASVRKWCRAGEMPGATQNEAGKWQIPATAVRPRKRVRR